MKQPFLDFLRRFRGFGISFLGFGGSVSFDPRVDERKIILKLFAQLGDRRVLFDNSCKVIKVDMVESANRLRDNFTSALEQLSEASKARPFILDMRKAAFQFSSILYDYFHQATSGSSPTDFDKAIEEMRESIGPRLIALCDLYGCTTYLWVDES